MAPTEQVRKIFGYDETLVKMMDSACIEGHSRREGKPTSTAQQTYGVNNLSLKLFRPRLFRPMPFTRSSLRWRYLELPQCYKNPSAEHSLSPSVSCLPSLESAPSVEESTRLSGNAPHHSHHHPDQTPGAHSLHIRTAYPLPNIMRRLPRASDHPYHLPVAGSAQGASRSSASTQ